MKKRERITKKAWKREGRKLYKSMLVEAWTRHWPPTPRYRLSRRVFFKNDNDYGREMFNEFKKLLEVAEHDDD